MLCHGILRGHPRCGFQVLLSKPRLDHRSAVPHVPTYVQRHRTAALAAPTLQRPCGYPAEEGRKLFRREKGVVDVQLGLGSRFDVCHGRSSFRWGLGGGERLPPNAWDRARVVTRGSEVERASIPQCPESCVDCAPAVGSGARTSDALLYPESANTRAPECHVCDRFERSRSLPSAPGRPLASLVSGHFAPCW